MDTLISRMIRGVSIYIYTIFFFLISGCSGVSTQPLYIPLKPVKQPTEQLSSPVPRSSPNPTYQSISPDMPIDCEDNLLYIDDITFPDWTNIKAGTIIDKEWLVENIGTCDWDYRYSLRLISGDSLGTENYQGLYPARAGHQTIIQISFTMPLESGTYNSVWQAYNPDNQPFGDPISILVVVVP